MAALTLKAPKDGRPPDPVWMAGLAQWCEARLPYFAVPRYFECLADLPRTGNGKIQKYRLRERGVTAATWERPEADRGQGGRR